MDMQIRNEDSPRRSLRNVLVGPNVRIFDFVNAYECSIGEGSKVGAFVEIQRGATIGKNCKISSHTFICEGVKIGDGVFVGHNVSFINDLFPRAVNTDGSLQTEADWHVVETVIEDRVSIGTSVTILGGVRIGEGAMIGAGSVVTKDVPAGVVVAGNPAKFIRNI
jgi:acetyltransferase-like isoleucine patch superfamily enzyme